MGWKHIGHTHGWSLAWDIVHSSLPYLTSQWLSVPSTMVYFRDWGRGTRCCAGSLPFLRVDSSWWWLGWRDPVLCPYYVGCHRIQCFLLSFLTSYMRRLGQSICPPRVRYHQNVVHLYPHWIKWCHECLIPYFWGPRRKKNISSFNYVKSTWKDAPQFHLWFSPTYWESLEGILNTSEGPLWTSWISEAAYSYMNILWESLK